MDRREVIIVGGGPAGAATALYLARLSSDLARRTLLLEKAVHPRVKVCAGGLIPHTLDCLDELGIGLSVPHVMVDRARVDVPGRRVEVDGRRFCAVVRRDEFDAALLAAVRACGVEVHEKEKVQQLVRDREQILVTTEHASYAAPLVVGADGSGSLVRRSLFPHQPRGAAIGRGVMADVPLTDGCRWDGHARSRYDFDFRAVPAGLAGYAWAFPCLIGGRPHVNAGVYTRRPCGRVDPVALLGRLQEELGLPGTRHQAAPIRCYGRERFAAPNVLLAGDAAGAEPLMGEGISFAFEYGRWAAAEIVRAAASGDLSLHEAEQHFRRSWVGKKLRRLDLAATMFYGSTARLWFALAARWGGAQRIGLCWYNGVGGWDRQSAWRALAAALGGAASAPPEGHP
jgi:flavin-dependent dehydrogenase